VVLRALAKRPEDRYPSARSFKEDLKRALNGDEVGLDDTMPPQARVPNSFLAGAGAGPGAPAHATMPPPARTLPPFPAGADPDATQVSGVGLPLPSAPEVDQDATVVTTPPGVRSDGKR
jgi:hypothetical protein